jgi:hypothetical protein
MGPYCEFCDFRCFVVRSLPFLKGTLLMATCAAGMAHDRQATGFDHTSAVNVCTYLEKVAALQGGSVELARSVAVRLEGENAELVRRAGWVAGWVRTVRCVCRAGDLGVCGRCAALAVLSPDLSPADLDAQYDASAAF